MYWSTELGINLFLIATLTNGKEVLGYDEKGNHTFRQKVCKICGKPFWPSNGQEVLCSEECKATNRRQKQLAYYHRKYTPWQLKFYMKSPLPWPQCEELFKQYKEYCSEHRFMRFDTWYATVDGNPVRDGGEDFDYSAYDDPSERYINYSWGEPLDKVNCEDETVEIDC